ncbi:MAG: helix-turn-helix domain-containing protein [Planctomycetota bacterium]
MSPRPDALLLTEREAAATLSISPRKLWELRMCGTIPCVRLGRSVRYDRDDLKTWIKDNKSRR